MAYTDPPTVTTNQTITTDLWNTYVRDNLQTLFPLGAGWDSYTPQLTAATTDPTLGSGNTKEGRYWQCGNTVFVTLNIQFGSSPNAGSGAYYVSVPVDIDAFVSTQAAVGYGYIRDDSASNRVVVVAHRIGAGTVRLVVSGAAAGNLVSDSNPWTWANDDSIRLSLTYEAA